ncbi:MAG: flagellar protein FliS [Rickettsiaceae bacterium]
MVSELEKYKNATVTGSAKQQMVFVLDEMLKLLFQAKAAMEKQDYETKFKALSKVTDGLYILRSGIDPDLDANTKMLHDFYSVTIDKLEQINLSGKDPEELQLVISTITQLNTACSAD